MLECHPAALGHRDLRPLQIECDKTNLREDPQKTPGPLGGRRLPTQDRLELPTRRRAPVAKRPVARGKRAAETVFPFVYVCSKA